MHVIPAIDLRGGTVVRLRQGAFDQETRYSLDPVEVVRGWLQEGAEWVHMVDLDGAKTGRPVNTEVIRRVAEQTDAKLQVGGGVRSLEHASWLLDCGVARVVFGTRIATDLHFAREAFEELGDRAVVGIDARNGYVAVAGWTESTAQTALELGRTLTELGARRFVFTDIATDGMMSGPNLSALKSFSDAVQRPVISSGGVAAYEHLLDLAQIPLVEGAIVGRAFIEGTLQVGEAVTTLATAGQMGK